MPTRTLSVVFTDIKGFTARTASSSRAELRDLLDRHEELLLPVIHHYDGTVVKTIGDAFLLTFESPTNAVLCGLMIQETLREFNQRTIEAERIEVRVAINTGEVEVRGSDVFGETVNIAARIEGITEAGEVYFTHSTYLSMNKSEVPTSEVGERRLKGIDEPIRVYRVISDENLERYNSLIASEREGQQRSSIEKPVYSAKSQNKTKLQAAFVIVIIATAVGAIFGPTEYRRLKANHEIDELENKIEAVRTTNERDEVFSALNKLAKDNPENNELLYRIALLNGADPYWIRSAFEQIPILIQRNEAYVNDKRLSEILFKALRYLDLQEQGPDTEHGKLRAFIAEKFATQWRDKLLPMVSELGGADRIERRNAYLVLKQSPLAGELNELRYFTIEFWGDVDTGNPWNNRTFSFLEEHASNASHELNNVWMPSSELPKFLRYFNEEADRAVAIVSSLYAKSLRNSLIAAVENADLGSRLHSMQIVKEKAWLTQELERSYHLANLDSYWKAYTSPWVVETVRYFAGEEPSTVEKSVLDKLQQIAEETKEIIDGGEVPDKRQEMADYQTRLDATIDALATLKK